MIELPESLEVTKSILSFLYTTSYTEDSTSPTEHSAGVYVAAAKYDIPALKTLACSKLASLFRSLESRLDPKSPEALTSEVFACIKKFLEVVVLTYDNTEDADGLRLELISTARHILRLHQTAVNNDIWVKCFRLAPAFALDLVKPESISLETSVPLNARTAYVISRSGKWRAATDCVIRECELCDTAVIMSKQAWEENNGGVNAYSKCPNHDACCGKLEHEIPNC